MNFDRLAATPEFPDLLLDRIEAMQADGSGFFAAGMFPSQRRHRVPPIEADDDNVFFTAVVLCALKSVEGLVPEAHRAQIEAITRRGAANYPRYLGNAGLKIYNFWQNHPEERFFPNSSLLSRFRHFRLAEDADDSACIYLTRPHDAADVAMFKTMLARHANGSDKGRLRYRLPEYNHFRAYATWFGGMPIDLDVCVMTNVMRFVFHHGLPLNEFDEDTLRFIRAVLENGEHVRAPFRIAPWYPLTGIILYHVTRLMHESDPPELTGLRGRLERDAHACAATTASAMERLLCSTSLMRLGHPPLLDHDPEAMAREVETFSFFSASFLTAYDHPITWALAPLNPFRFDYRCPAHSVTLIYEHEVMRRAVRA